MEDINIITVTSQNEIEEVQQIILRQELLSSQFWQFPLPALNRSFSGILVDWKSAAFKGELIFQNEFIISVNFTSQRNGESWVLTSIYASYTPEGKIEFLEWFQNIHMPQKKFTGLL